MVRAIFIFCILLMVPGVSTGIDTKTLETYNIRWESQSENSSESMPCGGGDIGLNVWVEEGDLLFYIARSGTFDENNTLLKLGRVRISLQPNPFNGDLFSQELKLHDGYVEIKGKKGEVSATAMVWVEIDRPAIHVEIHSNENISVNAAYENWRYEDQPIRRNEAFGNSYKWAPPEGLTTRKDHISFKENSIQFFHRNEGETVFDVTVRQQGMEEVKADLYNPLEDLTFGGMIRGREMIAAGKGEGQYLTTPFKSWHLKSRSPAKNHHVELVLHTGKVTSVDEWESGLAATLLSGQNLNRARRAARHWWNEFWNRSHVFINPHETDTSSVAWQTGRNYQLFRYMLACNAYGDYPTKFNGGLFTYDPQFTNPERPFTPDFRNWGGGTFTAQNQRLVYFPMFRSGDMDMVRVQIEFYNRLLKNAELRSQVYWGHAGASFTEQIENFGLPNPTEYGWNRPDYFDMGLEYNAWLEYQWDTALEICLMALKLHHYQGHDISEYIPFIESCLTFFDEHYRYRARMRGRRELNGDGQLVLYPGTACETYKMATNATQTIVALTSIIDGLLELPERYLSDESRERWMEMRGTIPPYRYRELHGYKMIAPAWMWERLNNTEVPQLYPVYPWSIYGMGRPNIEVARNTYLYDDDVLEFRSHLSWKQDNIFAARLGLVDEAAKWTTLKLRNSGRRFPAFWGPGFDWVPDHNWGGSGMIGLQEMLLQTVDDRLLLFPSWPDQWDVSFKLHAPGNTTIEGVLKNGEIVHLEVTPKQRADDVEIMLHKKEITK